MSKTNKLLSLRIKIDLLDTKLIHILSRRIKLVSEVARYKKVHNIKPLDKNRWKEVLKTRKSIGKSLGVSPNFIKDIFERIHTESLKTEDKIVK